MTKMVCQFRLRLARKDFDLTDDEGVLAYIERIVPVLRSLGPVEQEMYIHRLSDEFGISEHSIMMTVRTETVGRIQSGTAARRNPYRKVRHASAPRFG